MDVCEPQGSELRLDKKTGFTISVVCFCGEACIKKSSTEW